MQKIKIQMEMVQKKKYEKLQKIKSFKTTEKYTKEIESTKDEF